MHSKDSSSCPSCAYKFHDGVRQRQRQRQRHGRDHKTVYVSSCILELHRTHIPIEEEESRRRSWKKEQSLADSDLPLNASASANVSTSSTLYNFISYFWVHTNLWLNSNMIWSKNNTNGFWIKSDKPKIDWHRCWDFQPRSPAFLLPSTNAHTLTLLVSTDLCQSINSNLN